MELRGIVGSIINIFLEAESSWVQASLPVREGGLGIRSALQLADPASSIVLGSSVGDLFSISTLIEGKISVLKRMGERLKHFPSHDALLLLRHSLAIPRLLYSLRSAPCFLSPCLRTYDVELRGIVGSIINISLEAESSWVQASLAHFIELILEGRTPQSIRPLFFGTTLVALRKKMGGIRPIAVGGTLRRLVAKVATGKVKAEMSELLAPGQLGFGVSGGAGAAVHAKRLYLNCLDQNVVLLKLDFKNAFNCIRREKMLEATRSLAPDLYPLVHSAYSSPSALFWGDKVIQSSEGVQQGDPLAPSSFASPFTSSAPI